MNNFIALVAFLLVQSCLVSCAFLPGGLGFKGECIRELKGMLKDPDSYREDSPFKVVQEVEGSPKVFGWRFNAKNSFGGYGGSSEALCYGDSDGVVVGIFEGTEDRESRRIFLSAVNPGLLKEIRDERSVQAARATAERSRRIAVLRRRCEARRHEFEKGYGSGYLCSQYFTDGTFMESDIQDVQYTDEYRNSQ